MIETLTNLSFGFIKAMKAVYGFLTFEIGFGDFNFSVLEIFFGIGVVGFLTFTIAKWIIK